MEITWKNQEDKTNYAWIPLQRNKSGNKWYSNHTTECNGIVSVCRRSLWQNEPSWSYCSECLMPKKNPKRDKLSLLFMDWGKKQRALVLKNRLSYCPIIILLDVFLDVELKITRRYNIMNQCKLKICNKVQKKKKKIYRPV